jgi:hypothetical protein
MGISATENATCQRTQYIVWVRTRLLHCRDDCYYICFTLKPATTISKHLLVVCSAHVEISPPVIRAGDLGYVSHAITTAQHFLRPVLSPIQLPDRCVTV